MLDNIPARSRQMCPCCCFHGGSELPQWQTLEIGTTTIRRGLAYGYMNFVCDRSGLPWRNQDLEYRNNLARLAAIEFEMLEQAAREIDKTLL